jgi:hypothetical protein
LDYLESEVREAVEENDLEEVDRFNREIRSFLNIPNSSYHNYCPYILIDQNFKSVKYIRRKGLNIQCNEFLEELEDHDADSVF